MKFPLLTRAGAIAAVAVAVLFPVALVTDKVAERRGRAAEVESAFARETSGPQTVVGPLLALACEETVVEERVLKRAGKDDTVSEQKTMTFLGALLVLYGALYALLRSAGPCAACRVPPRVRRSGGRDDRDAAAGLGGGCRKTRDGTCERHGGLIHLESTR